MHLLGSNIPFFPPPKDSKEMKCRICDGDILVDRSQMQHNESIAFGNFGLQLVMALSTFAVMVASVFVVSNMKEHFRQTCNKKMGA